MIRKSAIGVGLGILLSAGLGAGETAFEGTWCVPAQQLRITFHAEDSLSVRSTADEGVSGEGAYEMAESTFVATVVNGELTIVMAYHYRWENDSTFQARPLSFTINQDTVSHPDEWLEMRRCAPQLTPSTDTAAVDSN